MPGTVCNRALTGRPRPCLEVGIDTCDPLFQRSDLLVHAGQHVPQCCRQRGGRIKKGRDRLVAGMVWAANGEKRSETWERPQAFAASRRRPSARASWRSARQSRGRAGTGRLWSASGTAGTGSRLLPDIAVAARPRQPDVAGAEGVAQVEQHRRLPEAVIGLGAQQPAPLRVRPQEVGRPRRAVAAQDADRFQQGLGRRRRLDVQRAEHSRRIAAETAVAPQDVIQRIRHGRTRERGRLGDKVAETLPSGTVRDHRVGGRPRPARRPSYRENARAITAKTVRATRQPHPAALSSSAATAEAGWSCGGADT